MSNEVDPATSGNANGTGAATGTGTGTGTRTGSGTSDVLDPVASAIAIFLGVLTIEWMCLLPLLLNAAIRVLVWDWWWCTFGVAAAFGLWFYLKPTTAIGDFFKNATTTTLVGVVFLSFALLSLAVMGVVFVPRDWQMPILRSLFVTVASLLPGVLCYLFVTTKRHSLLNEFLMNVERLGLLPEDFGKTDDNAAACQLEVYFRKFESVYGPLDEANKKQATRELLGRKVGERPAAPPAATPVPGPAAPPAAAQVPVPGLFGPLAQQGTGGTLSKGMHELAVRLLPANLGYPLVVATLLISLGWLLVLPLTHVASEGSDWKGAFIPEATPVNFAFLGAYFFSMQMLFRRYVARDLSGGAYIAVAIRILMAVIGTWAALAAWATGADYFELKLSKPFEPQAAEPINYGALVFGFAIGVFPEIAWQVIRGFFAKVFKFAIPSLENELPLRLLDGLTVWHETRLSEEDIENVPNMATIDVVQFMLHTPFPPERIVDWVDQAMLYTHLGPAGESWKTLRKHGIRTATEFIEAHRGAVKHGPEDELAFEIILGKEPGTGGRSCVRSLLDALNTDANLKLVQAWVKQKPSLNMPRVETSVLS